MFRGEESPTIRLMAQYSYRSEENLTESIREMRNGPFRKVAIENCKTIDKPSFRESGQIPLFAAGGMFREFPGKTMFPQTCNERTAEVSSSIYYRLLNLEQ